jgi:hypothetical protein
MKSKLHPSFEEKLRRYLDISAHYGRFNDNSFLLIGMNIGDLTDSGMIDLSDIKNRLCPDLHRYSRGYN